MRSLTPQTTGAIILCALAVPLVAVPAIRAIVDDPRRWSRPDVYLCIIAAIYAAVSLVAYWLSARVRRAVARFDWWQVVLLNPAILVIMGLRWAYHHDPLVPVTILAIVGWSTKRRMKKMAGRHEVRVE